MANPGLVALSPDGRRLTFAATDDGGETRLYLRDLDDLEARPVAGADDAAYPFWSPDGRHVAFFAYGKLKKVAVAGGPPVTLCDAPFGKGGSWNRQGTIVFPPASQSGLSRVSAAGGECSPLTELDTEAGDNSHRHPWFLPDGNRFLYLARRGSTAGGENMVRIGSLDGTIDQDLVKAPANAAYASGRLLFLRDTTLMAQPFDADRLELGGEAVPLVEDVLYISAAALSVFSVSESGELVYQTGQSVENSQLTWLDRRGTPVGMLGEPADQSAIAISSDGSNVVATMIGEGDQPDLWIHDVARDVPTRFTFSSDSDVAGAWSNAGDRIAFSSDRGTPTWDLYLKTVGGTSDAEPLLSADGAQFAYRWTPDDSMVLYSSTKPGGNWDLYAVPVDGDRTPIRLTETEFNEGYPSVSPDGRWLLYSSDESGRDEVYVTTFPQAERKWQISTSGGEEAIWTKGGTEILYLGNNDKSIFAVEVGFDGDTLRVGSVEKLFDVDLRGDVGQDWAVTEDGERFLINTAIERGRVSALHFVSNWPAILD
jgi:Tol biopolymer transport system component